MTAGRSLGSAVRWVVTDRSGGVSRPPYATLNLAAHVGDDPAAVAANRGVLAGSLGVPADRMVFMSPTHGRDVAVVVEPTATAPAVDVLVTAVPGVGLVALGADCVPVLLADPVAGIIAAVHAGWRGLALDAVGAALAAMAGLGADQARTRVVLGPAICGDCYVVPAARRDMVAAAVPEAWATSITGEPALDLRAGIRGRLSDSVAGVELVGGCTHEDPGLFSYRRDGVTGRQGAAIVVSPAVAR